MEKYLNPGGDDYLLILFEAWSGLWTGGFGLGQYLRLATDIWAEWVVTAEGRIGERELKKGHLTSCPNPFRRRVVASPPSHELPMSTDLPSPLFPWSLQDLCFQAIALSY